jgi:DNA-binding transcriptional LysR family regulator
MEIRFLKSLLCVVEEGSIVAASRVEGITASAVSQRISALEDEFGITLLTRSGRSIRPTHACTVLLPQIRKVVTEGQVLAQSGAGMQPGGPVRIGATSTMLTDRIPAIVRRVSRDCPGVETGVSPGTSRHLYRMFQDGALDFVLCVLPPHPLPKSEWFEVLEAQDIGLVRRADAGGEQLPMILYDRTAWGGKICQAVVAGTFPERPVLCELDALETIAIMVDSGLGEAVLPRWPGLARRFPDLAFDSIGADRRKTGLLMRTHMSDHPVVQIIRDAFRQG